MGFLPIFLLFRKYRIGFLLRLFFLSAEETPDIKFRNWFSGYAMFGAGLTTGEHLAVKIPPPPFFFLQKFCFHPLAALCLPDFFLSHTFLAFDFALLPLFLSEIFSFFYPRTSFLFSIFSLTVTLFNVLWVERGKYSSPVTAMTTECFIFLCGGSVLFSITCKIGDKYDILALCY
jgi:hypothetical protein